MLGTLDFTRSEHSLDAVQSDMPYPFFFFFLKDFFYINNLYSVALL